MEFSVPDGPALGPRLGPSKPLVGIGVLLLLPALLFGVGMILSFFLAPPGMALVGLAGTHMIAGIRYLMDERPLPRWWGRFLIAAGALAALIWVIFLIVFGREGDIQDPDVILPLVGTVAWTLPVVSIGVAVERVRRRDLKGRS